MVDTVVVLAVSEWLWQGFVQWELNEYFCAINETKRGWELYTVRVMGGRTRLGVHL